MPTTNVPPRARIEAARAFEAIADTIMYRWETERDVWVSTTEVNQARAYLERAGVTTSPAETLALASDAAGTLDAARLVLLGLRHLHAQRRTRPRA
jgi:hypothetical protein